MSKTQIKALLAAYKTGTAVDSTKLCKNGAHLKMLNRMVEAGLLTTTYKITVKGIQMLRENGHMVVEAYQMPKALETLSGPFRIVSRGTYPNGKGWTKHHGEPYTNRKMADAKMSELAARMSKIYGKDPAPFVFEIV